MSGCSSSGRIGLSLTLQYTEPVEGLKGVAYAYKSVYTALLFYNFSHVLGNHLSFDVE